LHFFELLAGHLSSALQMLLGKSRLSQLPGPGLQDAPGAGVPPVLLKQSSASMHWLRLVCVAPGFWHTPSQKLNVLAIPDAEQFDGPPFTTQFSAAAMSWRASWSWLSPLMFTQSASSAELALSRLVFWIFSPQMTMQPPAASMTR